MSQQQPFRGRARGLEGLRSGTACRPLGFSLIELLMAIVIMCIVFFAVMSGFLSGHMQCHVVNDACQSVAAQLMEDIRQSNRIAADCAGVMPKHVTITSYHDLDTRDEANPAHPANRLVLYRLRLDDSVSPPRWDHQEITWAVEVDPQVKSRNGRLLLTRSQRPVDGAGRPKGDPQKRLIERDIDKMNFYRIRSYGLDTAFFRIIMSRRDQQAPDKETYTSKLVGSAKLRSGIPAGIEKLLP